MIEGYVIAFEQLFEIAAEMLKDIKLGKVHRQVVKRVQVLSREEFGCLGNHGVVILLGLGFRPVLLEEGVCGEEFQEEAVHFFGELGRFGYELIVQCLNH